MSYFLFFFNIFDFTQLLVLYPILFLLFFFFCVESLFFQIILTMLFIIVNAVFLSFFNLDFFSGFLLTAELPIMLVSFFFFFHKNSLSFESVYSFHFSRLHWRFFFFICLLLFFLNSDTFLAFLPVYEFNFFNSFNFLHRNDFFIYYQFYYVIYPIFTLLIGTLIFLVSYIVILVYYLYVFSSKFKFVSNKQFSFIRKQNFLKQATYTTKLSFFKKK